MGSMVAHAEAALGRFRRIGLLALVGGSATVLYAVLAGVGSALLSWPIAIISLFAYGIAAMISYLGHRHLTFGGQSIPATAPQRFAGLAIMGYLAAFVIPLIASDWLGLPAWVPIGLTSVVVPTLNAWLLSRFVFRAPLIGGTTAGPNIRKGSGP